MQRVSTIQMQWNGSGASTTYDVFFTCRSSAQQSIDFHSAVRYASVNSDVIKRSFRPVDCVSILFDVCTLRLYGIHLLQYVPHGPYCICMQPLLYCRSGKSNLYYTDGSWLQRVTLPGGFPFESLELIPRIYIMSFTAQKLLMASSSLPRAVQLEYNVSAKYCHRQRLCQIDTQDWIVCGRVE